MGRCGDHRHRMDCGGLQAYDAQPVSRAPFTPPSEARVISPVDLATVVAAAAMRAQEVGASLESTSPKALLQLLFPMRRFAIGD